MNRLTAFTFLALGPLALSPAGCSADSESNGDGPGQSGTGGSSAPGVGEVSSVTGSSGASSSSNDAPSGGRSSTGGASGVGGGGTLGTGGASTSAGGASSTTGGRSSATGGASSGVGGSFPPTGGRTGVTGGASGGSGGNSTATGGRGWGTGGRSGSTGGTSSGTGGAPEATGGTTSDTGNATSGTGGAAPGACTFTVTQSVSEVIPTVGIVEWSVDGAVENAHIEFGLDMSYGLTAPVDLEEPGYRTLLLGMKSSREYHFRIVASAGGSECTSEDYSLTTGPLPSDLELPVVTTTRAEQLSGGYLITGRWGTGFGGPSFILDVDTDVVWWYSAPDDVMRTRFSYDGKWMWMRNTAQTDGTGLVRRVTLDGLTEEEFSLPRTTHDLAVLPDGHLGLIGHTDGCDEIVDFNPADGSTVSVYNLADAHGNTTCHGNFIGYTASDETFVVSDWENDCYVKVTRQGELVWVLNGEHSTFQGTSWSCQHGLHEIEPGHVLLFNNGAMGSGESSLVWEYQLNQNAGTATELWRYDAGISAAFGGDVQRLANGNTMIAYSSAGVIQELNPNKGVIQEMTWPLGYSVSYIMKEDSLYGGPPPRL